MLLLYTDYESLEEMFIAMFLLFGGIFFAIILFLFGYEIKQTLKNGGIKFYHPNIIKFLMRTYPNTMVTLDSSLYMTIKSDDITNDVTMSFSLKLHPVTRKMWVTGKIIPGNDKWAWIPPKEYIWQIDPDKGSCYSENMVIKTIKQDMIFHPEE